MSCYKFGFQSKGLLTVRREGIQTLLVLSINSSFKGKDDEDRGKSKAFEPNIQLYLKKN